jgi:hypothetical protein
LGSCEHGSEHSSSIKGEFFTSCATANAFGWEMPHIAVPGDLQSRTEHWPAAAAADGLTTAFICICNVLETTTKKIQGLTLCFFFNTF